MLPILQVGPLAIQVPGLMLIAGIWVGSWIIDKEAPQRSLSAGVLNNMLIIALVVGLLSARLWYALRFLTVYIDNPGSLFALNPSTLAPAEGAFTGLIAAWAYGQRKKLPFWRTLDVLAPTGAAFMIAIGLANLASGDAFGAVTDLPWAIDLWGARRHPSQVYELLLGGAVFLGVWRLRRQSLFDGFLFLSWLSMAAAARLLLEGVRGDSMIVLGTIRLAQLVSLAILMAAMFSLNLRARRT
jgi:prolipoprotein diacylglyceryltransferase